MEMFVRQSVNMSWRPSKRHRAKQPLTVPIVLMLGGAVGAGAACFADGNPLQNTAATLLGSGCNIKGNISINTGEHIYHVPGQRDYCKTVIDPTRGERWFCTEQEAVAAGWRKARN